MSSFKTGKHGLVYCAVVLTGFFGSACDVVYALPAQKKPALMLSARPPAGLLPEPASACAPPAAVRRSVVFGGPHERKSAGQNETKFASGICGVSGSSLDPSYHDALARSLFNNGQTEQALCEERFAVELSRAEPLYHYNLACLEQRTADTTKALDEYEKAIELSAANASAFLGASECLFKEGRSRDGLAIVENGLKSHAKCAALWMQYSLLALDASDLRTAQSAAQQALALDPQNKIALRILAQICFERGDTSRAIALGWQMAEGNPYDRNDYLFLIKAYTSPSELSIPEIERVYRLAEERLPSDGKLSLQMAIELLERAGRFPTTLSFEQSKNQRKLLELCEHALDRARRQYAGNPAFEALSIRCLEGEAKYSQALLQTELLSSRINKSATKSEYPAVDQLTELKQRIRVEAADYPAQLKEIVCPINHVRPLPDDHTMPARAVVVRDVVGCSGGISGVLRKVGTSYADGLRVAVFDIGNVGCFTCLMGIEKKLQQEPGVVFCLIPKRIPSTALVVYDDGLTRLDRIVDTAHGDHYSVRHVLDFQNGKDVWKSAINRTPVVRNSQAAIRFWDWPSMPLPSPAEPSRKSSITISLGVN